MRRFFVIATVLAVMAGCPKPRQDDSASLEKMREFKDKNRDYVAWKNRQHQPACPASEGDVPANDHPLHAKFARLTQQEEKHGLLDDSSAIGTREGWSSRLAGRGFALKGHRLVKVNAQETAKSSSTSGP